MKVTILVRATLSVLWIAALLFAPPSFSQTHKHIAPQHAPPKQIAAIDPATHAQGTQPGAQPSGQAPNTNQAPPAVTPPNTPKVDPMPVNNGMLVVLVIAGLMGMVGQGARTVVGLKKLSDWSAQPPGQSDQFDASRIFVGLMIGFIAGVATAITLSLFTSPDPFDAKTLMELVVAGYIGGDIIEAFTQTVSRQASSSSEAGLVTSNPTGRAFTAAGN